MFLFIFYQHLCLCLFDLISLLLSFWFVAYIVPMFATSCLYTVVIQSAYCCNVVRLLIILYRLWLASIIIIITLGNMIFEFLCWSYCLFSYAVPTFFYGFPMFFYGLPMFSHVFHWESIRIRTRCMRTSFWASALVPWPPWPLGAERFAMTIGCLVDWLLGLILQCGAPVR